ADFDDEEEATNGTYFNTGHDFTPSSAPSSDGYNGPTNIAMDQVAVANDPISIRLGFQTPPAPAPPNAIAANAAAPVPSPNAASPSSAPASGRESSTAEA